MCVYDVRSARNPLFQHAARADCAQIYRVTWTCTVLCGAVRGEVCHSQASGAADSQTEGGDGATAAAASASRGTRDRRGVLGAEPLCDGLALVGEPVRRADRVGHDLGDGPAAPLLPPSLSSVIARSNASAFATAARVSSRAVDAAAARAPTCTAFSAASSRTRSAAATSRALDATTARSAAARLAASAAASCFASRSASCCASSSLSHRAWASAPMPPSRTSRGAASSATSSADSPPTAMAAFSAASARSAADAAGLGTAAGSGAGAAADGTSLDSPPGAVGRPALFFFLDFFERACPLACSAASSASSSPIAASARAVCAVCIACGATAAADCGGAACGRVGSAVVVRPWALACRVGRCCGRSC
eukprot:scaffold5570_cov69-Phaeocystis_antarctica.AAC.4